MSSAAVFISSGSYAASGEHYQQTLAEPRLLHSSPVELITARAFCTVSLHKSSVDFRWSWTLLSVWSLVLADMNTSRRPFATCFIGSQPPSATANTVQYRISAFDCVREHCPANFNGRAPFPRAAFPRSLIPRNAYPRNSFLRRSSRSIPRSSLKAAVNRHEVDMSTMSLSASHHTLYIAYVSVVLSARQA